MNLSPEETETHLASIRQDIDNLTNATSPTEIADLRVKLAGWKSWVGELMVEAEMAFNSELNSAMEEFDLPATKATIKVKAGDKYRTYAKLKQFYNDLTTVVSAARTKLSVLEDEFTSR